MAKIPKVAQSVVNLQFRELSTGRFRNPVTGRFIPNPVGIKQLQTGAQMKFALHSVAATIAEAAKSLAKSEAYDTGAYMRSIRPASGIDTDPDGAKVMIARVNAFDFKAGWIEFGSIHNQPPHRILQRAAEAAGYQVSVGRNVRRVIGSGFERVLHLAGRK